VRIDTRGPAFAKASSGRTGGLIALRCRVPDALSPKAASVRAVVENSHGTAVRRFARATKKMGAWHGVTWRPSPSGAFRCVVCAEDLADNAQRNSGGAKVVVH